METYDFILQAATPGEPVVPEPVEAGIAAESATRGDGVLLWKLQKGDVVVRRIVEGGVVRGVELRVPLSDRTELLRETLARGYVLATSLSLQFVDPQLARTVRPEFGNEVEESFLRSAKYAGEFLGVSEAIGASFKAPLVEDQGLTPGVRVVLGVIVFVIMAIITYRAIIH